MILHIYAYRDKKLGAYLTPMYFTETKEVAVEKLSRSIKVEDKEKVAKLKDLELYYLGQYDDKVGIIRSVQPEYLLSLDEVITYGE